MLRMSSKVRSYSSVPGPPWRRLLELLMLESRKPERTLSSATRGEQRSMYRQCEMVRPCSHATHGSGGLGLAIVPVFLRLTCEATEQGAAPSPGSIVVDCLKWAPTVRGRCLVLPVMVKAALNPLSQTPRR